MLVISRRFLLHAETTTWYSHSTAKSKISKKGEDTLFFKAAESSQVGSKSMEQQYQAPFPN